jgi:hypothetical protein
LGSPLQPGGLIAVAIGKENRHRKWEDVSKGKKEGREGRKEGRKEGGRDKSAKVE